MLISIAMLGPRALGEVCNRVGVGPPEVFDARVEEGRKVKWAYSETNRRSGSKRRVWRPGGTSAEAQPADLSLPPHWYLKRVVDVRRRIVSVCDVRYGCAVTRINIAVPAFEEYDYLITGGLCFSRLSTCSR